MNIDGPFRRQRAVWIKVHQSCIVEPATFPAPLNIGVGDLTSPLDVSYLPVIALQNKTTHEIRRTTAREKRISSPF